MSSPSLIHMLGYVEIALSLAVLCFLTAKRQWRSYWALGLFLAVRTASGIVGLVLLNSGLTKSAAHKAYVTYFYFYWPAFAAESVLVIFILYSLFGRAMGPMDGLRRLGKLVFRWSAAAAVLLALGLAYAPHMSGNRFILSAISQIQQIQSLLILCVLLVVGFAIWKLGLPVRSKVFGVSLGLGLMAVVDLAQSWWLPRSSQWYTFYNLLNGMVLCLVLAMWAAYFAMREPTQRQVALTPDSKLFRLNAWCLQQRA